MKKFKLFNYILPSVISMVIVGTYTNIDGLFIGNRAGDDGLAAINIAWPIVAFITSLGSGLGVGAAIVINGLRGKNEYALAEKVKPAALWLPIAGGAAATIFCLLVYSPLLTLLGAEGIVKTYAENYSLVISLGAIFQVIGASAVVLLRNEGKTYSALIYTAIGLAVHVGLDFLTVKKFALYGVAAATVVSQAVVAALSLFSLLRRGDKSAKTPSAQECSDKEKSPRFALLVLKNSVAPFGLNFVPSMVLTFTNFFALKTGGTTAVGAYAVMSYVLYTYDYVFQGVCDGAQPVFSYYRGANDIREERNTLYKTIITMTALSVAFVALTPAAIAFLPKIFAVSAEAERMIKTGFIIYAFAYPLKAAVKFICAYAYSTGKVALSNTITFLDPFLFTPLSLLVLTPTGTRGIWAALPVSQLLTLIAAGVIYLILKLKHAGPRAKTRGIN
mgnify:FL=1